MLERLREIVPTAALAFLATGWSPAEAQERAPVRPPVRPSPTISTANGFVENLGQWDDEVLFFAREGAIEATVVHGAVVLRPRRQPRDPDEHSVPLPAPRRPLVLRFGDGTGPAPIGPVGIGELYTRHHYIQGRDVRVANARGFASVRFEDVAPGIDVVLTERDGHFAYDVHAAPGASLDALSIEVDGAASHELSDADTLLLHTDFGEVVQRIGPSWEEVPGSTQRMDVAPRFDVTTEDTSKLRVSFDVPGRDPGRALVIDPSLEWSTYVGGPMGEQLQAQGMAVDSEGAVLLFARGTPETPTTPGAFQEHHPPVGTGSDVWIGKISPDGSTLEWATFLGGSKSDKAGGGIMVDPDGTIVVTGSTWSFDFPTTPGTLQPLHAGTKGSDVFVTRLAPDGSSLVWSTFFGADNDNYEKGEVIEFYPSGDILIGGDPRSSGTSPPVPGTPGTFDPVFDDGDQMLFGLSADGSSLLFLTYFHVSKITDIDVDEDSNIYLGSYIVEIDLPAPVTPGAFQETVQIGPGNTADGVVAKLDPTGSVLHWCTYLGGNEGNDLLWSLDVDVTRSVYVAGSTSSDDFPVTQGAFQATLTPSGDGFVTKFLPDGSGLAWSTYLGANCGANQCGSTSMLDVAVTGDGQATVVGRANETFFPVTPDAFQPDYVGVYPSGDAILARLNVFGEDLAYGTWLGGSANEFNANVELDDEGGVYVAVEPHGAGYPVTPGAYDTTWGGSSDLAVTKFDLPTPSYQLRKPPPGGFVLVGGPPPPPPLPVGTGRGRSEYEPRSLRLSIRGAPRLQPGWLLVQRGALPLQRRTIRAPETWLPVATDPEGRLDLILPDPDATVTYQFAVRDPGSPAGWRLSNVLETLSTFDPRSD